MTELKPISEVNAELYEVLAPKDVKRNCVLECEITQRELDAVGETLDYVFRTTINAIYEDGAAFGECGHRFRLNKKTNEWECTTDGVVLNKIIGHEPTPFGILRKLAELGFDGALFTARGDLQFNDCKGSKPISFNLAIGFDGQEEKVRRELHKMIVGHFPTSGV